MSFYFLCWLIHYDSVVCVCLRKVVSNTYCVVFLFCFPSFFVPCVASFSGLSFLISPSIFSNVYIKHIFAIFESCKQYTPFAILYNVLLLLKTTFVGCNVSIKPHNFLSNSEQLPCPLQMVLSPIE